MPNMDEEPTNKDLMREIKRTTAWLEDHEERLKPLEKWKIAYDAASEALEQYKRDNVLSPTPPTANESILPGLNKEFVNVVLKFIGIIGLLIGLLTWVLQNQ